MQRLREMGHDITHDWTKSVIAHKAKGQSDDVLSRADRYRYAAEDLDGVARADVFWLRVPANLSLGAWIEMGYAIGLRKTIVVSGDHGRSIFTEIADMSYSTHNDAIEHFRGRAR